MRLRIADRSAPDYQVARDNTSWADHRLRTRITAEMIAWLEPRFVVDPAAGDGSVVAMAHSLRPIQVAFLGDISAPNVEIMQDVSAAVETFVALGSAEDILEPITEVADVVVLTEFLEHVEDPAKILRLARQKGKRLVASSPLWAAGGSFDPNPEHLWQFNAEGYDTLLTETGWKPLAMIPLYFPTMYDFQIWAAE